MERYRVTCLQCQESDEMQIDQMNHVVGDTKKKLNTNFLSFRWRPDYRWGFYCKCGNDNRVSAKEADEFDSIVKGDALTVEKIAASLLIDDDKQFKMEKI